MKGTARSWAEDRPIYKQLVEEIVRRIINYTYREDLTLPSVRQLASDFSVNPLTVARAYRELDPYIETERGVGLILKSGVRDQLLKLKQRQFLRNDWPSVLEQIESLELDAEELLVDYRKRNP